MVAAFRKSMIVSPSSLMEPLVKGGAQRMMAHTVRAIGGVSEHTSIVHGADPSHDWDSLGAVEPSQPAIMTTIYDGLVRDKRECSWAEALQALAESDLVVSVDRPIEERRSECLSVLSLSNLAYRTEREAARRELWDSIWVPSGHLADQLADQWPAHAERVHVVPPVLGDEDMTGSTDLDTLRGWIASRKIPRNRVLCFPHRSDPGKGLLSVLGLLKRLVSTDHRWRLVVTEPGPFDDHSNKQFFSYAMRYASDTGVLRHVIPAPWLSYTAMNELYELAGCTIVASRLPESFCLVPFESLIAGCPVVTTRLPSFKRHTGITELYSVDDIDSAETADLVSRVCGQSVALQTSSELRSTYSYRRHEAAIHHALGRSVGSYS